MKIAFIFLFLVQFHAFSQCDTSTAVDFPDVEAEFPGGVAQMKKFLQENIELPEVQLCSMGFTGRVYLTFIVCDDGSIRNIQIKRSNANFELERIAISVIEKMPNWIPAEVNGQPVTSRCRLPISINLQ